MEPPCRVLVPHRGLEPVHLRVDPLELQVPEHVVERPVLHHQDDHVVDLPEVRRTRVWIGTHVSSLRSAQRSAEGDQV
jgi:hypothetical protein